MGLFRAFWHRIRRKPTLRLNRLPYTQKTQVFSHLEHEDLLKFFRISRELRHYVLNNGPLPKKIQKIRVSGRNPRISGGRLMIKDLEITIFTEHQSLLFEIQASPGTNGKTPQTMPKANEFWAFQKLALCQKLEITLEAFSCFPSHSLSDLEHFLPTPRCLDELSICAPYLHKIMPIFSKSPAQVFSVCKLVANDDREIQEIGEFSRFFHENLENCGEIQLLGTRFEMASVYGENFRLQSTKLKRLEVTSRNHIDFRDFTDSLIEHHSDFPGTCVVSIYKYDVPGDFAQVAENLLIKLVSFEEIEDQADQWEISYEFIVRMKDNAETFKVATFFWRRISANSRILYIYLRNVSRISFQARVLSSSWPY